MKQATNSHKTWYARESKHIYSTDADGTDSLESKSAINTAAFDITRTALKTRLTSLQQLEKELIVKFTDAVLADQNYSELSQEIKSKQNEILHIKNKLNAMEIS